VAPLPWDTDWPQSWLPSPGHPADERLSPAMRRKAWPTLCSRPAAKGSHWRLERSKPPLALLVNSPTAGGVRRSWVRQQLTATIVVNTACPESAECAGVLIQQDTGLCMARGCLPSPHSYNTSRTVGQLRNAAPTIAGPDPMAATASGDSACCSRAALKGKRCNCSSDCLTLSMQTAVDFRWSPSPRRH